jgi:hypothetical protein
MFHNLRGIETSTPSSSVDYNLAVPSRSPVDLLANNDETAECFPHWGRIPSFAPYIYR